MVRIGAFILPVTGWGFAHDDAEHRRLTIYTGAVEYDSAHNAIRTKRLIFEGAEYEIARAQLLRGVVTQTADVEAAMQLAESAEARAAELERRLRAAEARAAEAERRLGAIRATLARTGE